MLKPNNYIAHNFELQIKQIEKALAVFQGNPPGTQLTRCLAPDSGFMWSLGVGKMGCPLKFYTGPTISNVVDQALEDYVVRKYPRTWEKILDVLVIDPDGWRTGNKPLPPQTFNKPLTKAEFLHRMVVSTCEFGPAWLGIAS